MILAKEEDYAKGVQAVFAGEFERQGGTVLDMIEFPANADASGLVERVMTLDPVKERWLPAVDFLRSGRRARGPVTITTGALPCRSVRWRRTASARSLTRWAPRSSARPDARATLTMLVELPDRALAIEIKSGQRVPPDAFEAFSRFESTYRQSPLSRAAVERIIVHGGPETTRRANTTLLCWRDVGPAAWTG